MYGDIGYRKVEMKVEMGEGRSINHFVWSQVTSPPLP